MRTYGLIGFPLTHSFSQKYFTEKFLEEGIGGCRYELFPIESVNEVPALLQSNPSLRGLNVTIPYKQSILSYLDDSTHIPAGLQACNCIRIRDGKLAGYNTDTTGFERSLLPHLKEHHTHALILGNGGAAAAIKYVLDKLSIGYRVVSRKRGDVSVLAYADIDEAIITDHPLIINTTPLGTYPDTGSCPDIPYRFLTARHLLYDVVYNPAKSLFLQKGEDSGAGIKNGYEMLVQQAEESWRIWNED